MDFKAIAPLPWSITTSGTWSGSQLGIPSSGMPFVNIGCNSFTEFFIHFSNAGSERWHTLKYDAERVELSIASLT